MSALGDVGHALWAIVLAKPLSIPLQWNPEQEHETLQHFVAAPSSFIHILLSCKNT